jgi:Tfp pilus assembly protein PilZ
MSDEDLLTATQSKLLPVEYATDELFLASFNEPASSLLVPQAPKGLNPGDRLALSIRVASQPGRVVVRGVVSPFRPSDGLGVVIKVRSEDAPRLRKAAEYLRGTSPPREERLPTEVGVEYTVDGVSYPASVRDVNTGGCFLATERVLPAGNATVVLEVKPPGARFLKLRVKGRVSWVEPLAPLRGFGVRFEDGQRAQVEKFLFTVLVED